MDLTEIEAWAAYARKRGLAELEIEAGGARLLLVLAQAQAVSAEASAPVGGGAASAATAAVTAPDFGIFRAAHPLREGPEVAPGDSVQAGDVVGFVEVGAGLLACRADTGGQVAEVRVADGALIGFGDVVVRLTV